MKHRLRCLAGIASLTALLAVFAMPATASAGTVTCTGWSYSYSFACSGHSQHISGRIANGPSGWIKCGRTINSGYGPTCWGQFVTNYSSSTGQFGSWGTCGNYNFYARAFYPNSGVSNWGTVLGRVSCYTS